MGNFLSSGITITVEYLPSALNKLVDQESQKIQNGFCARTFFESDLRYESVYKFVIHCGLCVFVKFYLSFQIYCTSSGWERKSLSRVFILKTPACLVCYERTRENRFTLSSVWRAGMDCRKSGST